MYRYYSFFGFLSIKQNKEVNDTNKEVFNNITYFIKNRRRVNCIHDGFVMYKNNVLINKLEVIPTIYDSMIPNDCCHKNQYVINFTPDDTIFKFDCMISKFEAFTKNKVDTLYLTKIMRTE